MIDLHEDRAGLRGAAPAQHRIDAFHRAAAQMRGDPEIRAQAGHHSTGSPEAAASSGRARREIAVTVRRRSRSKRSIAWRVLGPRTPSAFIGP